MESLPVEYVNCLLKMQKPPGLEIMHDPMSLVYIARERIVGHAIKNEFTHVLFIDSDMVFPPDTLTRLLKHDLDIVGALSFQRKPPYTPCVYRRLRLGEPGESQTEPLIEYERILTRVEGIGMGCTLINTKVFIDIYRNGTPCFQPVLGYGEDMSFCLRARHAGRGIYVDATLQAGHIGKMICTEDTFRKWQEVNG
jgi:GT2 family glycosyltransferase